jgi:hypothetical protein
MGDRKSPYWLGYHTLSGPENENNWIWADNDPATFTFWGGAEPNNYYRRQSPEGEDCMCFWHGPTWNDWWCEQLAMSMCKKVTPFYSCEYGTTTLNVSPSDTGSNYFSMENSKISLDAYDISAVGSYTLTVTNSLPGG